MARGDRRGPEGRGPMTGRGAGYCSGNSTPGFMNRVPWGGGQGFGQGFGRGLGRGLGRGFRNFGYGQGWNNTYQPTPQEERTMLKNEADEMKRSLDIITSRLQELEKEDSQS